MEEKFRREMDECHTRVAALERHLGQQVLIMNEKDSRLTKLEYENAQLKRTVQDNLGGDALERETLLAEAQEANARLARENEELRRKAVRVPRLEAHLNRSRQSSQSIVEDLRTARAELNSLSTVRSSLQQREKEVRDLHRYKQAYEDLLKTADRDAKYKELAERMSENLQMRLDNAKEVIANQADLITALDERGEGLAQQVFEAVQGLIDRDSQIHELRSRLEVAGEDPEDVAPTNELTSVEQMGGKVYFKVTVHDVREHRNVVRWLKAKLSNKDEEEVLLAETNGEIGRVETFARRMAIENDRLRRRARELQDEIEALQLQQKINAVKLDELREEEQGTK
jgi:ribosomal protein S7